MSVAAPEAPPAAGAGPAPAPDPDALPPGVAPGTPGGYGLFHGMFMRNPEYHTLYEQTPPGFRAELIEWRVYINRDHRGRAGGDLWDEPHGDIVGTKYRHASKQLLLDWWLGEYAANTPGVDPLSTPTVRMPDGSEPEPDAVLRRISAEELAAEAEDHDGWVTYLPALAAEVSDSTRTRDAGPRRRDYERNGVAEYLMIDLPGRRVRWFARDDAGAYAEMPPGDDGLLKSRAFPGLWLDPAALLAGDRAALKTALAAGLATDEHAAYVAGGLPEASAGA